MITVIVPAYNEGKNIGNFLSSLNGYNVIVVDDGSTDMTASIAKNSNVSVLVLGKNSGKGFACIEGLRQSKTEYCVFIDGDGQLSANDVPKIVEALKGADIVIGERDYRAIPFRRRLSNSFARMCVNYITGRRFNDVLCGLRGVRKSAFDKLKMEKLGYYFESEMVLEATKRGLRIATVPVSVNYNVGSRMPITKSLAVALWLFSKAIKKMFGMKI